MVIMTVEAAYGSTSIDACIMRGIAALRLNKDMAHAIFSYKALRTIQRPDICDPCSVSEKQGDVCPAPIDDYVVDGIPVSLASLIPR